MMVKTDHLVALQYSARDKTGFGTRERGTKEGRKKTDHQEAYHLTVRQFTPMFLADGAIALLCSHRCAVAPLSSSPPRCGARMLMCAHDGVKNGGASQAARNSKASSAFSCLRSAEESRCGPVPACAALYSVDGWSNCA